jgi:hypothetical protein
MLLRDQRPLFLGSFEDGYNSLGDEVNRRCGLAGIVSKAH